MKDRIIDGLAAATFVAITLHQPVLAQPYTEEDVGRPVIASYDYKEILPILTNQGTANIVVERHCYEDGSGSINISMNAGDFDNKKGSSLWVEGHPLNANGGTLAEVRESSEVKGPTEKALIILPKDTRFMVQIKEKVANLTTILKEFDVFHDCRVRLMQEPPVYIYLD
jgi:hypothetical protein